jgi:GNAT superfamily N-acetyltransferase
MEISYRPVHVDDYEEIRQLVIDMGWGKRAQDPDRFRRMMEGASLTVVALEAGRVVGFARALFDNASNGYISMVAVTADRQGRGIGRALVKRLMDVNAPRQITWVPIGEGEHRFLGEDGVSQIGRRDGDRENRIRATIFVGLRGYDWRTLL